MYNDNNATILLNQLQRALVRRDVRNGFAALDDAFPRDLRPSVSASYSPALLLAIAQWIDLGYRDTGFLDELLAELPPFHKAQLPLLDFLRIKLVEIYRQLAREELGPCIQELDLVLRVGSEFLSDYLMFLTHFWKGRAHRKRGDYEEAGLHLGAARAAAERARAPKLAAVTKIHQSWLAFQAGDRASAMLLLDEAEGALRLTGHALSLGNIESARGRLVRRSGEYSRALQHFEAAISIFRHGYSDHPNLARALVNAASVKRFMAMDLRNKKSGGRVRGATHERSLRITEEALELLAEAGKIYARHGHGGGVGSVLVNAAHLHLEKGDIVQAAIEGEKGYTLGREKEDGILMARSRIIQSAIELARAEEQLGDQFDIALHANHAVQYAQEAMDLAVHTQNTRLLAESCLAAATAAATDFFGNYDQSKDLAARAEALLSANDRDHLFKALGTLKNRLAGATRVEDSLRQWSEGRLGNKTFLQVQEEFAELVIPKVWLQKGKNATRVAKDLSISPKKVRRILRKTIKPG